MSFAASLWDPTQNSALANPAQWDLDNNVWSSEVQTAMYSRTFVARTLRNAQAMFNKEGGGYNRNVDFAVTGKLGAERHNRGDRYTGTQRAQIKRTVSLDERPYRVAVQDEYITRQFEQADTRMGLVDSFAGAHVSRREVEAMKMIALAARHTNTADTPAEFREGGNSYISGGNGHSLDFSSNATGAANVLKAIEDQTKIWDKLSVKRSMRICLLPVDLWYEVKGIEKVRSTATTTLNGGIYGSTELVGPKYSFAEYLSDEVPLEYMGVLIFRHNLIEATYDDEVQGFKSDHTGHPDRAGDFSSTVGLLYQPECAGWVDVMSTGLMAERVGQSTEEVVASFDWIGGGTLRPEAAVELRTTA